MNRMIQTIREVLEQGEDLVMATVVDTPGRNRLAGARMLIRADGRTYGSIGGGVREADVQRAAAGLFAARGLLIRILEDSGENAVSMRAPCGNGTVVAVEHIAAGPYNVSLFRELLEARQKGLKCCLISPVSGGGEGDGPLTREISRCDEYPLAAGKTGLVCRFPLLKEKLRTISFPVIEGVGDRLFFLNPWSIPETVYICGAGHVAQETAELTGKSGFRTIVLDDRDKYANRDRFPTADDVVVLDSFDDCFRGLDVTDDSYVIIATRGHRYEKTLVRQALRTRAGYIGLIGSVRKRDALFAELSGEGVTIDDLLRLYCPTGVSILAETPVEIAVSIVAQLVLLRAKRSAASRRDIRGAPLSAFSQDVQGRDDCPVLDARTNV